MRCFMGCMYWDEWDVCMRCVYEMLYGVYVGMNGCVLHVLHVGMGVCMCCVSGYVGNVCKETFGLD